MEIAKGRVVVTGGAGFIGSHVVDCLLTRGYHVRVIDDLSSGSLNRLAHHGNDPRLSFHRVDIRSANKVPPILAGARYVLHLATRSVRRSLRVPTEVHDVNTTGTLNILKASAQVGVRRLLYCSSSEVNGTAEVVPMPEDYPFRPETIYGASKLAGEYYAQVFHRSGWLETVVARPHNTYGPREHYAGAHGEVIPRFILLALAGQPLPIFGLGTQTRDFTYVEETSEFLVRLLECDAAVGRIFNVCRGEEASILEIADLVGKLTGSQVPHARLPGRPSDVLRLWGDNTRLKQALGATPKVSLRDGLARTVAWFRKNVAVSADLLESLKARNWDELAPEPWLALLSTPLKARAA